MGFKDRFANIFKDDEEFEENEENEEEEEAAPAPAVSQPAARAAAPARAAGIGSNSNLEMKIMKPENYESVTAIADQLLAGRTVVLNMEESNPELLRHIIDFCSGVVYAIGGNIKRAGNTTYVLTPKNVGISGEQAEEAAPKAARELF